MLRIIGGSARGIRLVSPGGEQTRPTLGRVRESIFNVLNNVGLEDTTVLDVFSGTGAMALEALSRGAKKAVCLDKSTVPIIKENTVRCHLEERILVCGGDVMKSLHSLQGNSFDYIFMDPPYNKGYVNRILDMIFSCSLYADNAIIVIEHSLAENPQIGRFAKTCSIWKEKRVGKTCITYLQCP